MVEQLEERRMLAANWQNAVFPLDVDGSGEVAPRDALVVISALRSEGSRQLPASTAEHAPPPYLDVDGNGWVEPVDAMAGVALLDNWFGVPLLRSFRRSSAQRRMHVDARVLQTRNEVTVRSMRNGCRLVSTTCEQAVAHG
jgi:hypothetical protein